MPSVTADIAANDLVQEALCEWLAGRGVFTAFERAPDGRKILYASTRPGKVQDFLINAHTDVVAAPPEMFRPVERDGWLCGRGTGDCKGNAVLVACVLAELVGKASVGAVFSSDEEAGGTSAETMVRLGYSARKLVVVLDSQPEKVCVAEKGHVYFTVRARGRSCHSSRPWEGENAAQRLLAAWPRLAALMPRDASAGDQWHDTMSVTVLRAGDAPNRVPDVAELVVNLRYVERGGADVWQRRIEEATGLEVERGEHSLPVEVSASEPIVERFRTFLRASLPGREVPVTKTCGATDARSFVKLGVPLVISSADKRGDHGADEAVRLASLDEYAAAISGFIISESGE